MPSWPHENVCPSAESVTPPAPGPHGDCRFFRPASCPPAPRASAPVVQPRKPSPARRGGVVGPPTQMRMHVLFHDNCFDGAASAAVFSRFYRERIRTDATLHLPGAAHKPGAEGIGPGGLHSGDENAIVDFRYSQDARLTWWFDHHASAFQQPGDEAHFRADTSGPEVPRRHAEELHDVPRGHRARSASAWTPGRWSSSWNGRRSSTARSSPARRWRWGWRSRRCS